MSATRIVLFIGACGLGGLFVGAALDGSWPDLGATGWVLLVGGIAVLSAVAIGVQALLDRRSADRTP